MRGAWRVEQFGVPKGPAGTETSPSSQLMEENHPVFPEAAQPCFSLWGGVLWPPLCSAPQTDGLMDLSSQPEAPSLPPSCLTDM